MSLWSSILVNVGVSPNMSHCSRIPVSRNMSLCRSFSTNLCMSLCSSIRVSIGVDPNMSDTNSRRQHDQRHCHDSHGPHHFATRPQG
jgi:hypothetical protein